MNERIEELAKECNILGEKEFAGKIVGFNYGKFAELIVKECVGIVMEDKGIDWSDSIRIKQSIEEEFGVEE